MECSEVREHLSARLDDQETPAARATVDAHVDTCPVCRAWYDDAARITRMARIMPAHATPDLVAAVMATAPRARRNPAWIRTYLRVWLGALGAAQIAISAQAVFAGDRLHIGAGGHTLHESAAWEAALGVGFIWVAMQVRRAGGLLPTLATFSAVLVALEVTDLFAGRTSLVASIPHVVVITALGVVYWLTRITPESSGAPLPAHSEPIGTPDSADLSDLSDLSTSAPLDARADQTPEEERRGDVA